MENRYWRRRSIACSVPERRGRRLQFAEPDIKQVMSGFNTTMFAYGQTGTGKTHLLGGDYGNTEDIHGPDIEAAAAWRRRRSGDTFDMNDMTTDSGGNSCEHALDRPATHSNRWQREV